MNVSIRLSDEENERLEELSRKNFRKKSDTIRLAISYLFERERVEIEREEVNP